MLINSSQYFLIQIMSTNAPLVSMRTNVVLIDRHWEVLQINSRILIGIDRHWALIRTIIQNSGNSDTSEGSSDNSKKNSINSDHPINPALLVFPILMRFWRTCRPQFFVCIGNGGTVGNVGIWVVNVRISGILDMHVDRWSAVIYSSCLTRNITTSEH